MPTDSARPVQADAFLGGAVMVLQPAAGYRSGLDAVLLAAAAPVGDGRPVRVLDLGAGVGVVGLCLAVRVAETKVVLLERDVTLAGLARANVESNALQSRVTVVEASVDARPAELAGVGLGPDSVDHCLANPPYGVEGQGRAPADPIKAAANAMPPGALDTWVRLMARVTRPGGTATLIHRADALGLLLGLLEPRFGGLRVRPVHAKAGEPAIRVLVSGIKGSRAPMQLCSGLVLQDADGRYRPEIEAVLRRPLGLPPVC